MAADWCNIGRVTVDMLPGDALLEIFDWYLIDEDDEIEAWQTLVHVCQKWRNVVFGSPHRLNLRLLCTNDRPVAKMLNIWPPLPIIIWGENTKMGEDNIVAALTHNVRVCGITLNWVPNSLWEKVLAAMQEPFPALTHLDIHTADEEPIVSSSFLGGSAPNLQYIDLSRVPFPGDGGSTETTFVCHSPLHSSPLSYPPFWIFFTRGDGHCSVCVDKPRKIFALVSIASILSWPWTPTSSSAHTLSPSRSY